MVGTVVAQHRPIRRVWLLTESGIALYPRPLKRWGFSAMEVYKTSAACWITSQGCVGDRRRHGECEGSARESNAKPSPPRADIGTRSRRCDGHDGRSPGLAVTEAGGRRLSVHEPPDPGNQ